MKPPLEGEEFTWDNIRQPLTWTMYSAMGYTALHLLVDRIWRQKAPKVYASLSRPDRILLAEKICSSLNGLVLGVNGVSLLLRESFRGTDGIVSGYPVSLHAIFAAYVGYSLYDMGTMFFAGNDPLSMWLHHIIGSVGAFLMMLYRRGAFFPAWFLVTECTVLPTNLVWYLKKLNVSKDSVWLKRAFQARTGSFLIFRSFWAPLCVLYTALQNDDGEMVKKLMKLPLIVRAGTAVNVSILGTLNLYWTAVIIGNYFKSKKKRQ